MVRYSGSPRPVRLRSLFGRSSGMGSFPPTINGNQEWFLFPIVCLISAISAANLFLKSRMVGAVPTAVARSAQLTEPQRSQTGVVIALGSHVSHLDVLDANPSIVGRSEPVDRGVGVITRSCHRWIVTSYTGMIAPEARNRMRRHLRVPGIVGRNRAVVSRFRGRETPRRVARRGPERPDSGSTDRRRPQPRRGRWRGQAGGRACPRARSRRRPLRRG